MNKHSDKALKTLAAMNTVPADWKQADIQWVEEEREILGWVQCPTCEGDHRVVSSEKDSMKPVTLPDEVTKSSRRSFYAKEDYARQNGLFMVKCRTCVDHNSRSRSYGYATGKVRGMVKRMVQVGYPIWPAGAQRDSRFNVYESNRYCCELCAKSLMSLQVPCVGTGTDGRVHKMWVGEDCAKKFLPGVHFFAPKKGAERGWDFVMDEVK